MAYVHRNIHIFLSSSLYDTTFALRFSQFSPISSSLSIICSFTSSQHISNSADIRHKRFHAACSVTALSCHSKDTLLAEHSAETSSVICHGMTRRLWWSDATPQRTLKCVWRVHCLEWCCPIISQSGPIPWATFVSVAEFVFSCLGGSSMVTLHVSTLTFHTIQCKRFNETDQSGMFFHDSDGWQCWWLLDDVFVVERLRFSIESSMTVRLVPLRVPKVLRFQIFVTRAHLFGFVCMTTESLDARVTELAFYHFRETRGGLALRPAQKDNASGQRWRNLHANVHLCVP